MVVPAIPLRIDEETLERLARLERLFAARLGGVKVSRSEVVRRVIGRGLDLLEAEEDWSALPAKERPRKTSKKR
jgi:hypothetical protein